MNILMIMADQFRADWMSCAGTDFVDTPNIDAIAKRGVRFKNAICNAPLCAPSRAAVAAGVYPNRLGVLGNYENFPIDRTTYYQLLRKNGYRVCAIGKTDLHKPHHFYGENGDLPMMYHLGFTDVIDTEGKMCACERRRRGIKVGSSETELHEFRDDGEIPFDILAGPYQKYLKGKGKLRDFASDYHDRLCDKPVWYSNASVLSSEDFHDGFIGKKSCEFLENVGVESPWHLFVSFVGPHDPWDAPQEYFDMYKDKCFPAPITDVSEDGKPDWVKKNRSFCSKDMGQEDMNKVKQHYAGMIKLIDDWVGKMLDTLDSRGLTDDTAIIFCSDHGEMLGDHGLFRKTFMYEGSLRVPLIVAHPQAEGGRTDDGLAEMVDLYPTILDIAGVDYLKSGLDGISLLPVLSGVKKLRRNYQFSVLDRTRMISDGKYKLIVSYNDLNELYDLENDPHELNNIISENPGIVLRLTALMEEINKEEGYYRHSLL